MENAANVCTAIQKLLPYNCEQFINSKIGIDKQYEKCYIDISNYY